MKEQNGIQAFEPGERPPVPKELTESGIICKYGLKIVELGGKLRWQAGTEDDYLTSEAQRTRRTKEEIAAQLKEFPLPDGCHYESGIHVCMEACSYSAYPVCRLYYNNQNRYYYCACSAQ